jgi:large subunit ribosomal protein L20
MSYSTFVHGLSKAGVGLNRKQLSEIAVNDDAAFRHLADVARKAVA